MRKHIWHYIDITTNKFFDLALRYGPRVFLAIIFLVAGLKVIQIGSRVVDEALNRTHIEPTVKLFLSKLIVWIVKVLLFVSVASMVGIETTSFVAMIGAAGLAIGLAFQGTLSNFAGGILILTMKPFKVGDNINALGYAGVVEEISIFNTKVITGENRVALIPNGTLANSSMINMTAKEHVRIELKFFIPSNADIRLAKSLIAESFKSDVRIIDEPSPLVAVLEVTETSIVLIARVWVTHQNYWPVYFEHIEAIKISLNTNGIFIPKQ